MGITGLLPYLRKIHTPVNISKFEGCTVAIDAYCWLHRGAFSCADKLAYGEHTDQYVYYCMKYVDCLLRKKVKPILVFDGCHLPSKGDVEKSRRERREGYRKKAAVLLREGKRSEAKECLQRCVDITAEMALQLINACRARGVDCIVAPYEADAQLAYLSRSGIAQVIITEDSDLLPFGCDRIVFKMDVFGNGTLIEKSRLNEVLQIKSECYTFDKFRYVCILSGCDYLPSLPGIGLAKANKVFKIARQPDLKIVLRKIPSYLKMKIVVTDEYIENFIQADNTFQHQLVFDPFQRRLIPLVPYLPDMDPHKLKYAGPYISDSQALQIALGNLDITTPSWKKIGNFDPDVRKPSACQKNSSATKVTSIWDKNYKVQSKLVLKEITCEKVSMHEKELTVNSQFIKKRSPVKRKRGAVDSEEVKCDSELVSMYDDDCEISPEEKRFCGDIENVSCSSENKTMACLSPNKSPRKQRPLSVTAADIWNTSVTSPDSVEEKKKTPVKHNRFAFLSKNRARFDLNVRKTEVRSRYFASSDNLQLTTPKTDPDTKADISQQSVNDNISIRDRHNSNGDNSAPTDNMKDDQSSCSADKSIDKCVDKNTEQNIQSKTNSVFGWSRFSFSSTNNVFSSESGCSDEQSKTNSNNSGFRDMDTKVEEDVFMIVDSNEASSQEVQQLLPFKKDNSLFSATSLQSSIVSRITVQSKSSPRGRSQCRVSGLARNSKKATWVDNDKQKSIKEMFSQFSYRKK